MSHTNENNIIERVLFGVTRGGAIAVAALSFAVIAVLAFFLIRGFPSPVYVSYSDVISNIKPSASASSNQGQAGPSQAGGYPMPPALKPFLDKNNQAVIQGWVADYQDDAEKQDFFDNLSRVLIEARQKGTNIADAANSYRDLKQNKLVQWPFKEYIAIGEKAVAVIAILSLLFLLLLISLVLVLLAIERHTRRTALLQKTNIIP